MQFLYMNTYSSIVLASFLGHKELQILTGIASVLASALSLRDLVWFHPLPTFLLGAKAQPKYSVN